MRLQSVLVAAALLVVGCSPTGAPAESLSPTAEPAPVVSPSVAVSPSPTVVSESASAAPTEFQSYPADLPTDDPESAAIIEGWQEYQRVYEKFASDPFGFTDFTETQYVTTGHESTVILDRIQALREENLALVGGLRFSGFEIGDFTENGEGLRAVVLTYCLDINSLEVRDLASGGLVERAGTHIEHAFMTRGRDGIWRAEGLNTQEESC